ncbi:MULTISPECIES: GNAT family N-acetyltransferase [Subtercola]|uniref:GNAT family N-acetyltransferase n=1 Tax=Subtercola vilae TaxID=2056433 RepID=A0A4T2BLA0_9MICO|nr:MULTISPECIES: GNAT family N-acetyltransferase [Subtercola]MEA9986614.1 GNAT family N-acetyltransferase [Subtercola sp. RTI3]TIH31649.1 GNAT family N-acetyltransferase [Subtercola vilae]
MTLTIRPITDRDFFAWYDLYVAYGQFYETPIEGDRAVLVWSWLTDPAHETEALVAEDDGKLVGLAHIREFARPLAGGRGLYLDDLFVAPDARGAGVASALLAEIKALAATRHANVVRWITDEKNETARRLYDTVANRTTWVTYDLPV